MVEIVNDFNAVVYSERRIKDARKKQRTMEQCISNSNSMGPSVTGADIL